MRTRITPNTSTPTVTATQSLPTPTFDTGKAVTKTSQPPAQCPVENPEITPGIADIISKVHFYSLGPAVLNYLNFGGTMSKLTKPRTIYSEFWEREITFETDISQEDLTGDGIPEIILKDWVELNIFGCREGKYRTLLTIETNEPTFSHTGASLLDAQDLNRDGIPELLIMQGSCGTCVADDYRLLEWDGTTFSSILGNDGYRSPYGNIIRGVVFPEVLFVDGFPYTDPTIHPTILRDIDQNGIKELIFSGGIPSSYNSRYHCPWRVESVTLSWNGSLYVVTNWTPDAPQFRFQAVQDGDVYTSVGKYDLALESYQQAIFSDKLDSWSSERQQYERDLLSVYDPSQATPVKPGPDPVEYNMLAAYSRFKIMLLHVIQGHMPEARTVYDTLLSKFPPGTEGSIYSELAQIFWNEYQVSNDAGSACSKVVQKVNKDKTIYLGYLGNISNESGHLATDDHGWWSLRYTPMDICPFQ